MIPIEEIAAHHHANTTGFSRHYLTLYSLVLGMEAKEVFEFGCGASTKAILAALERTGGKLITNDARTLEETGNTWEQLGPHRDAGRFEFIQGKSETTYPRIRQGKFDLVLHDGSHEWRTVARDLRVVARRVKQDGIILVHDTEHVPTFHLKLAVWLGMFGRRHEVLTLPYGYGLTIIRIRGNRGIGKVKLEWKKQKGEAAPATTGA